MDSQPTSDKHPDLSMLVIGKDKEPDRYNQRQSPWIPWAVFGVVGILLALPVNGLSTGTTNWNTFVEVAFAFKISPFIAQMGMIFAALMGLIGGFFPALTACRTPITSGLREI